jgi:hypothetical protein
MQDGSVIGSLITIVVYVIILGISLSWPYKHEANAQVVESMGENNIETSTKHAAQSNNVKESTSRIDAPYLTKKRKQPDYSNVKPHSPIIPNLHQKSEPEEKSELSTIVEEEETGDSGPWDEESDAEEELFHTVSTVVLAPPEISTDEEDGREIDANGYTKKERDYLQPYNTQIWDVVELWKWKKWFIKRFEDYYLTLGKFKNSDLVLAVKSAITEENKQTFGLKWFKNRDLNTNDISELTEAKREWQKFMDERRMKKNQQYKNYPPDTHANLLLQEIKERINEKIWNITDKLGKIQETDYDTREKYETLMKRLTE